MSGKRKKITVIDYGMGNLFNVVRAFEALECDVSITNDFKNIVNADKLLLPGVGAFEDGINDLKTSNLDSAIKEFSVTGRPLMGICLGMQLLMSMSEENGRHDGLNLIEGDVIKFNEPNEKSTKYKIPQIGWNKLLENKLNKWPGSILEGIENNAYMYFLHSYYVNPKDKKIVISETSYGQNLFCSVLQKNQIIGCQFHPERSGEIGLKILKNFIEL